MFDRQTYIFTSICLSVKPGGEGAHGSLVVKAQGYKWKVAGSRSDEVKL
jgi:hypothetical protein